MKNLKLLLLTFLTLVLVNCKKGKDDPFISLRSRDHRIVGNWKLLSGTVSYMHGLRKQDITYSEDEEVISGDAIFNSNMTIPHTFSINIKKDGSTEYAFLNSNSRDHWHWNNTVKNKAGLYLALDNFIIGPCDFNFTIDRLTNQELNLSYSSVSTVTVNNVTTFGTEVQLQFKKQ
jgi:hypothetical protein